MGGRVRLRQPRRGFRAAIDPVLLAAAVPAREGERVLEAGTGTGAAALCLLARVPSLQVIGLERDPDAAALACANAALNGVDHRFRVIVGDIAAVAAARAVAAHGACVHAMANPPFHVAGTPSPLAARRIAGHESAEATLAVWIAAMARRLVQRGTLTLILPPARLPDAIAACAAARIGSLSLLPLWSHEGEAARRVILQGVKEGRGPCRILAGLVLHRRSGGYTSAAERILKEAERLRLD
ncbi:methyltransferase [Elioraea sp.]|uniref:tRNA1(Val) (adenine(37)-N6)-methyltransferase n=1 Tax=Elioraea sp. TaxID=2185103 RepID=UPI00307E89C3